MGYGESLKRPSFYCLIHFYKRVTKMCFDIGIVTCGPNEALVVSGMGYGEIDPDTKEYRPFVVMGGGRAIVCPCLQTIQRITLNTMTLEVFSPRVYTSQGVPISVTGIAQVKINGANEDMIVAACEQFGDKSDDEVTNICLETMEGHQRAIMGNMTVEQIYRDRITFSKKVFEVASVDLHALGISVISYRIKEEEMQVKVVEREQQIAIQQQEIQRKEKELNSKVRAPAEAEKYRLEKIAEAEKSRTVLEAEAEAEQMAKKADAWKEYEEAALVDMMLKVLPRVAAEVSAPLAQTDKITMVSTGDGPVGASKLTEEMLS